jgi:hypothetical protein
MPISLNFSGSYFADEMVAGAVMKSEPVVPSSAVGDIGPIEGDMGNAVCNTQQNRSLINHRQAHVSSVIPPAELT